MIKFTIVGKPSGRMKNYRGVDRHRPTYVMSEDEKAEINQLFFWSTNIFIPERSYLTDIEKGKRLIELSLKLSEPIEFELLEITFLNESPVLGSELIGFDIVAGTVSVLSYGLPDCDETLEKDSVGHLICLIGRHYIPQLNGNALFDTYDVAKECLDCMRSLVNLVPDDDLWEMRHSVYKVVGLYKINL